MGIKKNIITILIPHFNDTRILGCLDKINKTTFRKFLKIVIQDAGSKPDLIKKIKNKLNDNDELIVKKDKGIFDALNILLDNVKTQYFTWIGCDDIINEDYCYDRINELINKNYKIINSNVVYFINGKASRRVGAYKLNYCNYLFGKPIYHFATTISIDVIKDLRFNIKRKTAADFEFFSELLRINKLTTKPCKYSTVYIGDGGNSSKNIYARMDGYKDIFKSFLNYKIFIFPIFLIIRIYYKLVSKVR